MTDFYLPLVGIECDPGFTIPESIRKCALCPSPVYLFGLCYRCHRAQGDYISREHREEE